MFKKKLLTTADIFSSLAPGKLPALNDLFTASGASDQPLHECYFEDGRVSGLPTFVVPYKDDEEGFYADVATYYPSWSPITAHVHVLLKDQVPEKITAASSRARKKVNASFGKSLLNIWSALAYAEAASLCLIHNLPEQEPSFGLCRRTLAFSVARASYLYPSLSLQVIAQKWNNVRSLTVGSSSSSLVDTVIFLSSILRGNPRIASDDQFSEVFPFLPDLDFQRFQINSGRIQSYLVEYHPDICEAVSELSGDFDRRMEAFQKIVDLIRLKPHSELIDTITIAFFADKILPGSMRYMRVLGRLLGTYQSILVWYGFFSALSDRYASESSAIAIDRKIQRDISQYFDLSISPQVDISIGEFNTLSRVGRKSIALRPVQPRSVFLSLLPGIEIHIRLSEEINEIDGKDSDNLRKIRQRDKLLINILSEAQKILGAPQADDYVSSKYTKNRYGR